MFLIRPAPFKDESLSSWRHRAGMENGFCRFPCKSGFRKPNIDADRRPPDDELDWLSDQFAVPKSTLIAMSLDPLAAKSIAVPNTGPKLRWVLSGGLFASERSAGPMYCPICLATDSIPYFRLAWRLGFITQCPIHRVRLLDACPKCAHRIWPATDWSPASPLWRPLRQCQFCHSDLCNATALPATGNDLSLEMLDVNGMPPPGEYLDGLWVICRVLIRKKSTMLRSHLRGAHDLQLPEFNSQKVTVEHLQLNDRHSVLTAGRWLLNSWPIRFIDIAHTRNLTRQHFQGTEHLHPQWLYALIDRELVLKRRAAPNTLVDGQLVGQEYGLRVSKLRI